MKYRKSVETILSHEHQLELNMVHAERRKKDVKEPLVVRVCFLEIHHTIAERADVIIANAYCDMEQIPNPFQQTEGRICAKQRSTLSF